MEEALDVCMSFVVELLNTDLPSQIRWYTFDAQLDWQGLGTTQHNLLPRLAEQSCTFCNTDGDEGSFQAHKKKKTSSLEFLAEGTAEANQKRRRDDQ